MEDGNGHMTWMHLTQLDWSLKIASIGRMFFCVFCTNESLFRAWEIIAQSVQCMPSPQPMLCFFKEKKKLGMVVMGL